MIYTEYVVVEHRGPRELEHDVNELLAAGWQLVGGISISEGGEYDRGDGIIKSWGNYAQAMAR